jgi:hypothetical protein
MIRGSSIPDFGVADWALLIQMSCRVSKFVLSDPNANSYNIFSSGLSELTRKPEFFDSIIIDQLAELLTTIFPALKGFSELRSVSMFIWLEGIDIFRNSGTIPMSTNVLLTVVVPKARLAASIKKIRASRFIFNIIPYKSLIACKCKCKRFLSKFPAASKKIIAESSIK